MGKSYKLGVTAIIALLGLTLGGCDTESLTGGDDEENYARSTLYLKASSGAGVAGISYSCDGGYTSDGDLIVSGTTSSAGDMSVSYWPGYDLICNITTNGAPKLYLYNANGPINNAQVSCTSFNGFTGEDGVAGSINNASSDTCRIRLLEYS